MGTTDINPYHSALVPVYSLTFCVLGACLLISPTTAHLSGENVQPLCYRIIKKLTAGGGAAVREMNAVFLGQLWIFVPLEGAIWTLPTRLHLCLKCLIMLCWVRGGGENEWVGKHICALHLFFWLAQEEAVLEGVPRAQPGLMEALKSYFILFSSWNWADAGGCHYAGTGRNWTEHQHVCEWHARDCFLLWNKRFKRWVSR